MLELVIILAVVALAIWLVIRRLHREIKGDECIDCSCGRQIEKPRRLTQIQSPDKQKPI